MKKRLLIYSLIIASALVTGCKSGKDKNHEDPNKAPMYRPIHHSKDSATALR